MRGDLLFIVLVLVDLISATCSNPSESIIYVDENEACDDVTTLCKFGFQCITPTPSSGPEMTCEDVEVGDKCEIDKPSSCGDWLRCSPETWTCEAYNLTVGEMCTRDEQCLSGNCHDGYCRGIKKLGDSCNPLAYECDAGLFCSAITNNCTHPHKIGENCWAERDYLTPNWVCEPGSSCISNGNVKETWCVPLYGAKIGQICDSSEVYTGCEYGTYCWYNKSKGSSTCHEFSDNEGYCSDSNAHQCTFGSECNCAVDGNKKGGSCEPYVKTDCDDQLKQLIECIIKNKLPFDPIPLIGENDFLGPLIDGSLMSQYCELEWQHLACCQNDLSTSAYSPANIPQFCGSITPTFGESSLIQNWEVAMIIIALIVVAVALPAAAFFFYHRRRRVRYHPLRAE